jgi:isoquinoline 1-oxidoreductase alpha subunit
MIMAAAAMLQANPKPSEADIAAEMTNICRCGTYNRVKAAIQQVAAGGELGRG